MEIRQIDDAVTIRARVRVSERSGFHKGAEGIVLGFRPLYGTLKVGFTDDSGEYTGECTTVAFEHVDLIDDGDRPTETFRVLVEMRHPRTGNLIGAGTRLVQAADKDEAARVAVAEEVAFYREKNAKARAEMARMGTTWPLGSEDPKDYVVTNVRRAPKRRSA